MKPTVIKQPENEAEKADFENAKAGCPVQAIEE
jgi:ferredoxin